LKYELYAALHEWGMGKHNSTEFSANTFLDMFEGHVNTFRFILKKHSVAFHVMMGDLYSQARWVSPNSAVMFHTDKSFQCHSV
jgi:hypothetical protein